MKYYIKITEVDEKENVQNGITYQLGEDMRLAYGEMLEADAEEYPNQCRVVSTLPRTREVETE